jgi:hypothetical protein
MSLIEVLPDYEAKRFDKLPTLSNDEQKHYMGMQLTGIARRRNNWPWLPTLRPMASL